MQRFRLPFLFLASSFVLGCTESQPLWLADPLAEPQTRSLLGEDLYAIADTTGTIAGADAALATAPDDVELLIAAARPRWDFMQYRQAVAMYERAMELAPDNLRLYVLRGGRYISLREFDRALEDFTFAKSRTPNDWTISYDLGLLYFLTGRFDEAADEYLACLTYPPATGDPATDWNGPGSCSRNAVDPQGRVAMTEWAVRALLRAGRRDEADDLLVTINADLDVTEGYLAYLHDLLFYKGLLSAEELLADDPDRPYRTETVAFGIANWYLAEGDTARAVALFEEIAVHPMWPGFGRIAAEAELSRLR